MTSKLQTDTYGILESVMEEYKNRTDQLDSLLFRLKMSIGTEISIENSTSDLESEIHIHTMKLCDAWFAYEASIPIYIEHNLKAALPYYYKKITKLESLEDIPRNITNVYDKKPSSGLASFFDSSNFDGVSECFLEFALDEFKGNLPDNRSETQKYILHLEKTALGAQSAFLLDSYNNFTQPAEVKPVDILAVSYAIRNQYVHNGETSQAGNVGLDSKLKILKGCYQFTSVYSMLIAMKLIEVIN